ncbi:MAG: 2-iminoacetate synthase ThiH [Desulfobacterales bacterium]|nr:2-iminoacetate synthase ThiH [Desulfobacterales bacterium]
MSFYDEIKNYNANDIDTYLSNVTNADIEESLSKRKIKPSDFLNLLSEPAGEYLEQMAQKAQQLTVQNFGHTINLFIPLYISDYCTNECIYCGFNKTNKIHRQKLTLEEIEKEGKAIAQTGMRHLLLLTGEARDVTPIDYIESAVNILKPHFASISIEMFPMDTDEYRRLKLAGVDGLTLFQEAYDKAVYKKVHLSGKKADYHYRIEAPDRGAAAGFRMISVGALFGLAEVRKEAFFTGIHAKYIADTYLDTEISFSMPRINPAEGGYIPDYPISDKTFVQCMMAYRLFLPRAGITISTREKAEFRNNLIGIGATKLSAGVKTDVGGYARRETNATPQFEISDHRSVDEMAEAIRARGYQPVYKDWQMEMFG